MLKNTFLTRKDSSGTLAKRTDFSSCQMSVLVVGGSSSEQVWKGIKGWPLDVTSKGGLYNKVPVLLGGKAEGPCRVRFNAPWVLVTWGPPLHKQTHSTENIAV